jgi:hypothetical protein
VQVDPPSRERLVEQGLRQVLDRVHGRPGAGRIDPEDVDRRRLREAREQVRAGDARAGRGR